MEAIKEKTQKKLGVLKCVLEGRKVQQVEKGAVTEQRKQDVSA